MKGYKITPLGYAFFVSIFFSLILSIFFVFAFPIVGGLWYFYAMIVFANRCLND